MASKEEPPHGFWQPSPDAQPVIYEWDEVREHVVRRIREGAHINELMGRHPYHPFAPDLAETHPCHALNAEFGQCMDAQPVDVDLHYKHIECYRLKLPLMVCLTRVARLARTNAAKETQPA